MENIIINTMTGYIYVGKHSDINTYGKKSTTGNGFYNTIFVTLNKNNKIKADIFIETAEFVNEMHKKYGHKTKNKKKIIDKINNKLKNYTL